MFYAYLALLANSGNKAGCSGVSNGRKNVAMWKRARWCRSVDLFILGWAWFFFSISLLRKWDSPCLRRALLFINSVVCVWSSRPFLAHPILRFSALTTMHCKRMRQTCRLRHCVFFFFLGPCVAGVVGLKKPRYDIFGETVDITRQLEEAGTGKETSTIKWTEN